MEGRASSGVANEAALLAFADAVVAFDPIATAAERMRVRAELGEAALADAAGVIAGFNGIVRIADATGIPLEPAKVEMSASWRPRLGIEQFTAAKS